MKKSKSIECNICHLILLKKNFDRHMETHGKRDCKECNQTLDSRDELEEHKKVHLCCPECPELGPFQDKDKLVRHIETHDKRNCKECNQTFDSRDELENHKKVHLCCPQCPELGAFHDKGTLNRHKKDVHQNCFHKFQNEVKYGPIFPCISCHRCLYENGVSICQKAGHQETFDRFVRHMNRKFALDTDFSGNRSLHICHDCKNKIAKGRMPAMCFANNLLLEHQPKCLRTLSEVESTLIATNIPVSYTHLTLPTNREV